MVAYMEMESRPYQLGLCMEHNVTIALHEEEFPMCREVIVVLSLWVLDSL